MHELGSISGTPVVARLSTDSMEKSRLADTVTSGEVPNRGFIIQAQNSGRRVWHMHGSPSRGLDRTYVHKQCTCVFKCEKYRLQNVQLEIYRHTSERTMSRLGLNRETASKGSSGSPRVYQGQKSAIV